MAEEESERPHHIDEDMWKAMRERLQEPELPFNNDEKRRLRQLLTDYDRAAWLRKVILRATPIVIAVVTGIGSLWQWLSTRK